MVNIEYISPDEVHSRFLQTCDIPAEEFTIKPFTMVIFDGAGDLSQRKLLPALYHLYHEKKLPDAFSILGFGLPSMSDGEYRKLTKDAFAQFSQETLDESVWAEFCRHLSDANTQSFSGGVLQYGGMVSFPIGPINLDLEAGAVQKLYDLNGNFFELGCNGKIGISIGPTSASLSLGLFDGTLAYHHIDPNKTKKFIAGAKKILELGFGFGPVTLPRQTYQSIGNI